MTKAELDSKHLAELHSLAAKAGVPRYRMLPRAELVEKLLEGGPGPGPREKPKPKPERPRRERPSAGRQRGRAEERPAPQAEPVAEPEPVAAAPPAPTPRAEPARPKRRRRRLWGRRGRRTVRLQDLLLPVAPGRQAILYAESRERCTALLRELATELSGADGGADPIALLIDPSPEELAAWRREAPRVEIIAAGQARHAEDAVAHAARRAEGGEEVILLIDSLSRFAAELGSAKAARNLLDRAGTLTAVGGLEHG